MNIASIFKSKTRRALFQLYFTNPENNYYLRELERMLDIPVSMIRKELMNLESDGVFLSKMKGNQRHYLLNIRYPLFDELKGIVFKTIGVQGMIEKTLKGISGIEVAFIYGSFAKNKENAASDIDVFIIGSADEKAISNEIRMLEQVLKREINYTLYARCEFSAKRKNRDPFIRGVLTKHKIFLVGDKNDL